MFVGVQRVELKYVLTPLHLTYTYLKKKKKQQHINTLVYTVGKVVVFGQVCCNIWQKNMALSVPKFCGEFFFVSGYFKTKKTVTFATKLEGGGCLSARATKKIPFFAASLMHT